MCVDAPKTANAPMVNDVPKTKTVVWIASQPKTAAMEKSARKSRVWLAMKTTHASMAGPATRVFAQAAKTMTTAPTANSARNNVVLDVPTHPIVRTEKHAKKAFVSTPTHANLTQTALMERSV